MSNIGSQLTEAFAGLDRTNELMNISSEYDNLNRNIAILRHSASRRWAITIAKAIVPAPR